MGCCIIKSLPGVNDNQNHKGITGRYNEGNEDDMDIDDQIEAYTIKNSTNKKLEFTYEMTPTKDERNIELHEENSMSNKDIFFKVRDRYTKKGYYSKSVNTEGKLNANNNNFIKKGIRSKSLIFEDDDNSLFRINMKLECFNLNFPYFFSYFNFDFINNMTPEITIELNEKKKNFTGVKFTCNNYFPQETSNTDKLNKSVNDTMKNCLNRNKTLSHNILHKNDKTNKNIKFIFKDNLFIEEYKLSKVKNSFICVYLYAKNTKSEINPYLIGEAFIPMNYLTFKFDFFENVLEIPLINKTNNIVIGYLKLNLKTSESIIEDNDEIDLETSKFFFENYFKSNTLTLDFYEALHLPNTNFNFNYFTLNNLKIKLNNFINRYSETLKKNEVIKNLITYISEKDLKKSCNSIYSLDLKPNNHKDKYNEKEMVLKIDKISYTKYYSLLSLLNEYLFELIDKQNQQEKKLPKNSDFKFLNEKLIYSPFLEVHQYDFEKDEEFDLMILTNAIFTFISNLHKAKFIHVDSKYADCLFILRDLGSLFAKSKSFLVRFYKEELKNNPIKQSEILGSDSNQVLYNIIGMKYDIYYSLILDNIYKYLFIVNSTIDLYIKALIDDPEKRRIVINEIRFANLKSNYEFFIFGNEIFINDIFIANSVINIFLNIAKFGKLYSTIYHVNKQDCYMSFFSDVISKYSDFFKDLFSRFYISHIFFKSFIEFGEIVTNGSPKFIKFNFFVNFNMKVFFERFNIEAKDIKSKKFNFWSVYLNLFLNIITSFSYDRLEMMDYYQFNHMDFIVHFVGLFSIMNNYPYFKILSHNDISFDMDNLIIKKVNWDINIAEITPVSLVLNNSDLLKNSSSNNIAFNKKFLGSFQSLNIFACFMDIFYEIVIRRYLLNLIVKKYKKIFMGIFDKMVFVVFYQVDIFDEKYKNEIRIKFFLMYSKIMGILYKMHIKYNFNLQSFLSESFKNIFKKENKEINVSHLLKKLSNKIFENKSDKIEKEDILESKEINNMLDMMAKMNKKISGG